jgi:hypothetical protein
MMSLARATDETKILLIAIEQCIVVVCSFVVFSFACRNWLSEISLAERGLYERISLLHCESGLLYVHMFACLCHAFDFIFLLYFRSYCNVKNKRIDAWSAHRQPTVLFRQRNYVKFILAAGRWKAISKGLSILRVSIAFYNWGFAVTSIRTQPILLIELLIKYCKWVCTYVLYM